MSVQVQVTTDIKSRPVLLKALNSLGFEEVKGVDHVTHYNGKTTATKREDVVIGDRSAFVAENGKYGFTGDLFYDNKISNRIRGLKIRSDREAGAKDFVDIVANAYNSINIKNEAKKVDPYSKVTVDASNPRDVVVKITVS